MQPIKNEPSEPQTTSANLAKLERERLVSLINSMADGVVATDELGKIVLYNGAALNILDVNVDLISKQLEEIATIIDRNSQPVDISKLITETKTQHVTRDLKLAYRDGSISNLYLSIAPVKLGYGKRGNKGFVVLMRDITREKSLEEERDEFISVISHELRTPIAIAEGNISNAQFTVARSNQDSTVQKALDDAHEQILFLSGMINDLATLSRAERGKLNIELESINAHDLVAELAKEYTAVAKQKQLEFHSQISDDLELLSSSKLYVREILQNFITNAIKYTDAGSVTLGAKRYKEGVLFEISDTGIGISKIDQEHVFDKFFRSEDYRTRAHNGTGLGLYVTMKLVRLIHAEVDIHSEINTGSTFSMYVPNIKGEALTD